MASGREQHSSRRRWGVRGLLWRWMLPAVVLMISVGCTVPLRVEWSTELEMDTAGFDLYRGEAAGGPFHTRINEELIPASPDPMAGGRYSFVDPTARAGRTYYYQLQEVELGGAVNTFGPIEVRAPWLDWRWALALALMALSLALLYALRRARATEHSSTYTTGVER